MMALSAGQSVVPLLVKVLSASFGRLLLLLLLPSSSLFTACSAGGCCGGGCCGLLPAVCVSTSSAAVEYTAATAA
jgi:hypothetical protein